MTHWFVCLSNYLFTTLSLYSTFIQVIVVQQAKHYYLILLSYQYKAISSAYLSGSFAQNKSLNLEDIKESLLTVQVLLSFSSEVKQSSSKSVCLDVLKWQTCMINKLMSDMQETLITLLCCFKSRSQSQWFISSSKSSDWSHQAEKSTTISLSYLHLSALTSISTKRSAFKPDTRWSAFELRWNNDYNSDYDMKEMSNKCISNRKREKLKHNYY